MPFLQLLNDAHGRTNSTIHRVAVHEPSRCRATNAYRGWFSRTNPMEICAGTRNHHMRWLWKWRNHLVTGSAQLASANIAKRYPSRTKPNVTANRSTEATNRQRSAKHVHSDRNNIPWSDGTVDSGSAMRTTICRRRSESMVTGRRIDTNRYHPRCTSRFGSATPSHHGQ